ncbi:MAG: glycosyltransferase [Beggiatoa sp. IS2]|nr:MAG: glycosyltransferase [Beggiatoa sp. IS2]
MTHVKLSIVFLNYNRLAETRYTLAHLQHLLTARDDIEIIAVDNGSSDGTREFLQSQTQGVHVICLDTNTGIAGYNEGFQRARGQYVFVLDDDSHPVDSVTLDRLIEHLDTQPQVGVVACRIENPDGQVVHSWHLPKSDEPCLSMAFVGCGFAIRRDLFADIGWYPADFFLYQNEIEVAIQVLRRQYQIIYDPRCRVVHRQSPQGRTTWRRVYYPTRNTIWLLRRYFPWPAVAYLIISRLSLGFIRAVQSREFRWYYRAVVEAFTKPIEPDILPTALREQLTAFWRQNSIWHQLTRQL